jgi:ketosteroid isomerase-like protein
MAVVDDFGGAVEQYYLALGEFLKGNPEPVKKRWFHRDDVSVANPYGPPARGWAPVAKAVEQAAATVRDGKLVGVEIVAKEVTPELAYVVGIERFEAKVGGREKLLPFVLRATMILRPEGGDWKVVHRHADPITTARPAESVLQK